MWGSKHKGKVLNLETAKATLECARGDALEEMDRMKVLDAKLTNIAAFSGVSISISGSIGGSVLAANRLSLGFSIALGGTLTVAGVVLLSAVAACFAGLAPKNYKGISEDAAQDRVKRGRLRKEPAEAIAIMASTYYT